MADRHNRDIDRPRAPLPEPLPVPTVDAHAHMEIVTDAAFDSQEVADVIAEAKSVNVDRIVQVGYSAEQSKWCVAAAEKWNTTVLAAVALHPNEAPVVADLEADLKIIEKLAQHPRVRMKSSLAIFKCSQFGFHASWTNLSTHACGATLLLSAVRITF